METTGYLTAREAANELGISLATLYSYVSRGLIRSEAADERKRTRRYRLEDVRRLKERKEQRHNPARTVENALHWGTPVMESAITLIADNRLYYRGQDVLYLAANYTVEQVAALIWDGELSADIPGLVDSTPVTLSPHWPAVNQHLAGLSPVERFQVLLPLAAVDDLAAYDLRSSAVAQTGARILQLFVTMIAAGNPVAGSSISQKLQQGWIPDDPQATPLINTALILCADHELNVSSFTARCVASAGATPYQVVSAGLAALQGVKHGRNTERVEAFLRELDPPADVRQAMAGRLKRGEPIPGFGHPLYPGGDPRGQALLDLVGAHYPDSAVVALANKVSAKKR